MAGTSGEWSLVRRMLRGDGKRSVERQCQANLAVQTLTLTILRGGLMSSTVGKDTGGRWIEQEGRQEGVNAWLAARVHEPVVTGS